ncbi:MAG: endonuclease domain-containing protein [Parvibaculaceae bacterium]
MTARTLTGTARRLRRDMTEAEKRLWLYLHGVPAAGGHWRRPVPIGSHIADFANHSLRIVIVVDGDQHGWERNQARDRQRDQWLASQGYRVLRFWNNDVLREIEGVMTAILEAVETAPPPHKGEGRKSRRLKSSPSPLMGEGRGGGELPARHHDA